MRIGVVGAGPAGLLFALLAKRRRRDWQVEVVEQNPPDATFALREHHAEAERGVGGILLGDCDVPGRKAPLGEQRKQEPGRAGADDADPHRPHDTNCYALLPLPPRRKPSLAGWREQWR